MSSYTAAERVEIIDIYTITLLLNSFFLRMI